MKFTYQDSCGVADQLLKEALARLEPAMERLVVAEQDSAYSSPYSFAHLPFDKNLYQEMAESVKQKKQLQPTLLVLVGIGGSALGTLAVHEALRGTRFYCVDTVEAGYTAELLAIIKAEFEKGGRVLVVVATKSGTTTETLVNSALLFDLLKRYYKENYQDYLVIITDSNSPLSALGKQLGCMVLAVPEKVGGRFSVLSPVGLFPLGMLGVDIHALLAGAQQEVPDAAISAAILYEQYLGKRNIHDTFLFAPALASLGAWYRQLMGESIGKEYDQHGHGAYIGMTPTVSLGSNDLHSVVQLYLAGPFDKITTFVALEEASGDLVIPDNEFSRILFGDSLPPAHPERSRRVQRIHQAIYEGTRIAYREAERPFMTCVLKDASAFEIGQFLKFKMYEIVYLGFLLDVNVFDQPRVELYKSATRQLLKL